MKVLKVVLIAFLALVVGFIGGASYYYIYNKPVSETLSFGELKIHFLELGNKYTGDCVLIQTKDNDILIDAGSKNDSAPTLISYIDSYVTDNTLEYVIATHAHEDHIAGFYSTSSRTGIFDHYKVNTIIDFPNTNKDVTNANTVAGKYTIARNKEVAEGAKHWTALECYNNENGGQRTYEIAEGIELEILYNYYYDHTISNDENNYSVCIMINQGENHYLFTGDLEKEGEAKLVQKYDLPHCKVYKAGHHGSPTSSSAALMDMIQPEYVCVCCCAGSSEYTDNNLNQFPSQDFINHVAPYTDKIFVTSVVDNYVEKSKWTNEGTVTSLNGNIVLQITRSQIEVNCSNNNTILKDTAWFQANRTWPAQAA